MTKSTTLNMLVMSPAHITPDTPILYIKTPDGNLSLATVENMKEIVESRERAIRMNENRISAASETSVQTLRKLKKRYEELRKG